MQNPEVLIGIPSTGSWCADFGMSLAGLMASAGRPLIGGGHIQRVQLWNTKGSILPRSRETLARKALELGCSHLLFLDSDQTFPLWTLHQMLRWKKPVVAANIATKELPANPTARQRSAEKSAGELVSSEGAVEPLEQVWRVGTGIMLVETEVFRQLPQPWFPIEWKEAIQDYVGEDWMFCDALERAGIPIFVDHQLSLQVGHVGSFEYRHEHTKEQENDSAVDLHE